MTITSMKIDYYDIATNVLTFSVNPQSMDDQISSNYDVKTMLYQRYHMFFGLGGLQPKQVVLTGYFFGTNKMTDYGNLASRWADTQHIHKLYFQSDRFYLGVGQNIKMTQTSSRTNFTDYVATFQTFIGILLGDSAKTTGTNGGNVPTYVTTITGTYSGSGNVVITDGYGNSTTINGASLVSYTHWRYSLVKLVNAGSNLYYTEYGYCEKSTDGNTYTQVAATHSPWPILMIDVGANVSTITITNSGTNTVTFRDGWIV